MLLHGALLKVNLSYSLDDASAIGGHVELELSLQVTRCIYIYLRKNKGRPKRRACEVMQLLLESP